MTKIQVKNLNYIYLTEKMKLKEKKKEILFNLPCNVAV